MIVISHNYQDGPTQEVSDYVFGTTSIVRRASEFRGKRVLFCGVMYMAEDMYNMADGQIEIFLPEIQVKNGEVDKPRCPMIKRQRGTDIVTRKHLEEARKHNPDMILSYINTPSSIKAETNGVYNGTVGLKVVGEIAEESEGRGRVAFIGDYNVNEWIADKVKPQYPEFEVISVPVSGVQCPSHVKIDERLFMETYRSLKSKFGDDLGLEMHAEVTKTLREFGFENNAYFGGTDGLVDKPKESDINHWLIGTVEGVIDRLRRETTKDVYSVGIRCPNMSYTTPEKVMRARDLLEDNGPVAVANYSMRDLPYFDIEVLRPEFVRETKGGATRIPAVRITLEKEISVMAKGALTSLL
ncbi:MAG: quinolinate synthase NadA [Thermoplasmata archaeon]